MTTDSNSSGAFSYRFQRALLLAYLAFGLITSLVIYGVMQERIMQRPWGDEDFDFPSFLVFWNRVLSCAFGVGLTLYAKESFAMQLPWWRYVMISLTNVGATLCQYESLVYVSFALMMLGKSAKMIPVMLWGMAISGKRYSIRDWMVALTVTGGVLLFLWADEHSSDKDSSYQNTAKGLILIFCYLMLDGLQANLQEKALHDHGATRYNLVVYVNFVSTLVSLVTMFYADPAGLLKGTTFCWRHDGMTTHVMTLSLATSIGQYFIYTLISEFGALVFAACMNVRQLASIITSYIIFGHVLSFLMLIGFGLVFGALFYKSYFAYTTAGADDEKQPLVGKSSKSDEACVKPNQPGDSPVDKDNRV